MKLAEKLSALSTHHKYYFGCVIYKSNRVMSVGINKDNSAPKQWTKQTRPNMSLHAEIDALLNLTKDQCKNAVMYVYGKTRKRSNCFVSKPCDSCLLAIDKMGIKRVVYMSKGELQEIKL